MDTKFIPQSEKLVQASDLDINNLVNGWLSAAREQLWRKNYRKAAMFCSMLFGAIKFFPQQIYNVSRAVLEEASVSDSIQLKYFCEFVEATTKEKRLVFFLERTIFLLKTRNFELLKNIFDQHLPLKCADIAKESIGYKALSILCEIIDNQGIQTIHWLENSKHGKIILFPPKQYTLIVNWLKETIKNGPYQPYWLYILVIIYMTHNEKDLALECSNEFCEKNENDPNGWLIRARILSAIYPSDIGSAHLESWGKAIALDPSSDEAFYVLLHYYYTGKLKDSSDMINYCMLRIEAAEKIYDDEDLWALLLHLLFEWRSSKNDKQDYPEWYYRFHSWAHEIWDISQIEAQIAYLTTKSVINCWISCLLAIGWNQYSLKIKEYLYQYHQNETERTLKKYKIALPLPRV